MLHNCKHKADFFALKCKQTADFFILKCKQTANNLTFRPQVHSIYYVNKKCCNAFLPFPRVCLLVDPHWSGICPNNCPIWAWLRSNHAWVNILVEYFGLCCWNICEFCGRQCPIRGYNLCSLWKDLLWYSGHFFWNGNFKNQFFNIAFWKSEKCLIWIFAPKLAKTLEIIEQMTAVCLHICLCL